MPPSPTQVLGLNKMIKLDVDSPPKHCFCEEILLIHNSNVD